jgi:hypothetical protein
MPKNMRVSALAPRRAGPRVKSSLDLHQSGQVEGGCRCFLPVRRMAGELRMAVLLTMVRQSDGASSIQVKATGLRGWICTRSEEEGTKSNDDRR